MADDERELQSLMKKNNGVDDCHKDEVEEFTSGINEERKSVEVRSEININLLCCLAL